MEPGETYVGWVVYTKHGAYHPSMRSEILGELRRRFPSPNWNLEEESEAKLLLFHTPTAYEVKTSLGVFRPESTDYVLEFRSSFFTYKASPMPHRQLMSEVRDSLPWKKTAFWETSEGRQPVTTRRRIRPIKGPTKP